ncbi:unnamed protein product [Rotaria sp. Silwood2]|nr:unnamed protein product [Rotaria sp. Silwood2]CAF3287819.1 unnamed protein product [Rotaria sp. Silwood2]CAF4271450.1 unnamed protein product [Rotaria sp. Silwood2]CAF4278059.1 unnamed protein product [Rotaria sp. Silwood2]
MQTSDQLTRFIFYLCLISILLYSFLKKIRGRLWKIYTCQQSSEAEKQFHRQNSLTDLHEAVAKNSEANVRKAITNGIPIDLIDHAGQTALYYGCERGFANLVNILLQHGARHDILDVNQTSPLWAAAQKSHAEIVLALLQHGADPDQQANDNTTALYHASYEGHLACVYYLVRFKASVHLAKNSGASPLFVAARNGHYRIVKHLLKYGANPFQTQADGRSPLHTALLYSRTRCAQLLFACDPLRWIPQVDIYGWTHLHFLAKNGNIRMARLFFHHVRCELKPIDFEQIDSFGNTPLHIAMFHRKTRFANYLIESGFNIDRSNFFQWTPTMIDVANRKNQARFDESSPKIYLTQLLGTYRIDYTAEEDEMRQEVETYVRLLIFEMEKFDPLFRHDLICSGSYYERTRIGVPNEFDYMINLSEIQRLCTFFDDVNYPSGYGRLYPLSTNEAHEKLRPYLEPTIQCVSSVKIRKRFYQLLTSARAFVIHQETIQQFKHLKFEWTSGDKRCGTAIHAEWYGSRYAYLTIKIDVVPCLTVYRWPRTAKVTCPLAKPEFQIIARSPKPDQTDFWRISTSRTELVSFLSLVDEIKDAYLSLKTLRYINPYECRIDKVTYVADELLTSYMIKSEFLHEISRYPQSQQWIKGGLIHRVTSILKRLHRHLQQGLIPSFYIENYNVIDGDDYARLRSFEIKYVCSLLKQVQEKARTMNRRVTRSQTFAASESIDPSPPLRVRASTTSS